jgi:hypothetical protein
MDPQGKVRQWVTEAFEPASVEVSPWPYLPYGLLVRDHAGRTLVAYWDIDRQQVAWVTRP